jgi:HNH endonuclease
LPESDDKTRLTKAAKLFGDELVERKIEINIKVGRLQKTDTGGWMVFVGTFGDDHRIEMWLDKFLGTNERCFWIGFAEDGMNGAARLAKKMPSRLQPSRKYYTTTLSFRDRVWQLKKPPSHIDISRPILESFRGDGYSFYGLYDKGGHGSTNPQHLDVQRAAGFVENVLQALADISFSAREGARRHLEIESPIRNSSIRRRRCEKDKYTCQVCSFNFMKRYGILGKEFAKVHHVAPLGKVKAVRVTSLNDLRTVCANCHRMLHRMRGNGLKDIQALRKIVAKGNSEKSKPLAGPNATRRRKCSTRSFVAAR